MRPHSPEVIDAVVAFVNEFHHKTDGRQFLMPIVTFDPHHGVKAVGASVFHDGTAEEAESFYAPLLQLQPCVVNNAALRPYPEANSLMNPMAAHGRRYMFGGASFTCPLDLQLYRDATDQYYKELSIPGNEEARTSVLGLEVIPQGKIMEHGALDKTAFSGRQGKYNAVLLMSWDTEARDRPGERRGGQDWCGIQGQD